MNIRPCLRRHHCAKRVGILLAALALFMGVTGCGPGLEMIGQNALIISSSVGGSVVTPGEGTFAVDYGTVVTLMAEADDNHYFVRWTGDTGTIADPYAASTTIIMEGSYTITAEFGFDPQELIEYDLTISSTTGGSVTIPGEGVFPYEGGTTVDLAAEAEGCYEFVEWTGDVDTIADAYAAETTITMNDDYSVTANFERIEYSLNISSKEGGSVIDPGEGMFIHDCGQVVNLVAEADDCYEFVGWTGEVDTIADAYAAETTITMNDDYSVTANFQLIEYSLIISSTNGGSVTTPGEGTFVHDCGQVVNLVAEVDAGYRFDRWTGDVDTIADVYAAEVAITMDGDYSITAEFVKTYTLTVDSTVGGNAITPGEGIFTYDEGTVVDLVAVADMYYEFAAWTGDTGDISDPLSATTTITMTDDCSITATFAFKVDPMVAAGGYHTVGLTSSGTLVAAGNNDSGQCAVGDWENIIQIATGEAHTVGLKYDGTVVAVGDNDYHQCEVSGWTGIAQVAAGGFHTVGLKDDGTVVAAGLNNYGQLNVGGWEDIVQVAAGSLHTVGLKSDGTVVAVGWNLLGQCNVGSWGDVIQVTAGSLHTVGLTADGSAVAVGWNAYGQLDVESWDGIIQVAAGEAHTVGFKHDGSVVAVGSNAYGQLDVEGWSGIIQVAAGEAHTVGLKDDGTVVAVGDNDHGQCDVDGWNLN